MTFCGKRRLVCAMPVYNRESMVCQALDSVAGQTRRPDLIVMHDNGSTDRTVEVVKAWAAAHPEIAVRVEVNPWNEGLVANLNRCLAHAEEAFYLHIMTSDDLLEPTFYEKSLAALELAPSPAMSYCLVRTIDAAGKTLRVEEAKDSWNSSLQAGWQEYEQRYGWRPSAGRARGREVSKFEFLCRHAELDPVCLPGVVLKTCGKAVAPGRGFSVHAQVCDILFLARWAAGCAMIREVPEALLRYRWHDGNHSRKSTHHLRHWLLDEWEAMGEISSMIEEGRLARWVRKQRLACLFAARACEKIRMTEDPAYPAYREELRGHARGKVSRAHWFLGWAAWRSQGLWRRRRCALDCPEQGLNAKTAKSAKVGEKVLEALGAPAW